MFHFKLSSLESYRWVIVTNRVWISLTGFGLSCFLQISLWKVKHLKLSRCVSSVHVTWSEPASALSIDLVGFLSFAVYLGSLCDRVFYCLFFYRFSVLQAQWGRQVCGCLTRLLYDLKTSVGSFHPSGRGSVLSSGSGSLAAAVNVASCPVKRWRHEQESSRCRSDPDGWENGFRVSDVKEEPSAANPRKLKSLELVGGGPQLERKHK